MFTPGLTYNAKVCTRVETWKRNETRAQILSTKPFSLVLNGIFSLTFQAILRFIQNNIIHNSFIAKP